MSVVSIWRDNLNIGIYLTEYGFQPKTNVLEQIGYVQEGSGIEDNLNHYHGRLRKAIERGAQNYTERNPGWFYVSAFPFNGQFLYRTTWYVCEHGQCLPLAVDPYARNVKEWRVKDTSTRIARTRAAVAVEALDRMRRAVLDEDLDAYNAIMKELADDETYGPLMEIVSGHYGLEYADAGQFIELLLDQPAFSPERIGLGRALKDIRKAKQIRDRGMLSFASALAKLVLLRAGSRNPRPQALAEARRRLASLPAA